MRLLPVRTDHVGLRAACQQSSSERFRYRGRDVGQHLPLRNLCAYPRSDQASRAIGRLIMTLAHIDSDRPQDDLSRRGFLRASAAASGGLLLSLSLPFAHRESQAAGSDTFEPNAFIRIGGDGQIVLTMPYVEMGQGTYTAIPLLIAEAAGADLKR